MALFTTLFLLAAAPPEPGALPPPSASLKVVGACDRRASTGQCELFGPQLFFTFSKQATEEVELGLHVAVQPGPALVPRAGYFDASFRWRPGGWGPGESLAITVYPLGASGLQLGFDPLLRVGSTIPGQGRPLALKAGLARGPWSAHLASKSVELVDSQSLEVTRRHSALLEGTWSSPRSWKLSLGAAFLPAIPSAGPSVPVTLGELNTLAAAARAVYRSHGEIGAPLDLDRVERTPWGFEWAFPTAPPRLPDAGVEVVAEAIAGRQLLADPLQFPQGDLVTQALYGWRASVRGAFRGARVQVGALGRTPSLVLADRYGMPSFQAFPAGSAVHHDLWFEASADVTLPVAKVTPGVLVRVRRPGGFAADAGPFSQHTILIDELEPLTVFPDASAPRSALTALLTATWTPAPFFTAFAQAGYAFNPNQVAITTDGSGNPVQVFTRPHGVRAAVGFQLIL